MVNLNFSNSAVIFTCIAIIAILLLVLVWTKIYGIRIAAVLGLCRMVVLSFFLSVFFPRTESILNTDDASPDVLKDFHIFLDDSLSVPKHIQTTLEKKTEEILTKYGLRPNLIKLTSLDPATQIGYSPLFKNLQPWLRKNFGQNWLVISDGADEEPWNQQTDLFETLTDLYQSRSQDSQDGFRGVLHFAGEKLLDLSIETVETAPLLFQDKPSSLDLVLARRGSDLNVPLTSQIQIYLGDEFLTSDKVHWAQGETLTYAHLSIPPIKKGLIFVRAVLAPDPSESTIWNNERIIPLEVLTNTVGVLHLLGRPSWDGRYFRRFIKTEPKFDIVSFFILRDLFDDQPVPENELSLIPFPVEQLFTDELASFKLITMQDFSLSRYLKPEYQKNLISYVKSGGSLLMIGGDKALASSEFESQEIASLLPFQLSDAPSTVNIEYKREYRLRLHSDDAKSMKHVKLTSDLKLFFETYPEISTWKFKGLHRIDSKQFNKNSAQILIDAVDTQSGEAFPFLIASLPENGRAIWIMSDQLWTMSTNNANAITRRAYADILNMSTRWLLKDQWLSDIDVTSAVLRRSDGQTINLSFNFKDQLQRYSDASKLREKVSLTVCGSSVSSRTTSFSDLENGMLQISGSILISPDEAKVRVCPVTIEIGSTEDGIEKFSLLLPIYERVLDSQNSPRQELLEGLASRLNASFLSASLETLESKFTVWLENGLSTKIKSRDTNALEADTQNATRQEVQNPFWAFENRYNLLLLATALFIEVYLRRWRRPRLRVSPQVQ